MKKMIILAALLQAISAWAGDLSVDNLTVSSNAAIYGKMDIISVVTDGTTNGATATGGTITTNGNYRIHTFTNVGTTNFTVSGGALNCEVLVVAGGGGGGACDELQGGAGGGGAGGLLTSYLTVTNESVTVVVGQGGDGGLAGNNDGENGSDSYFGSVVSYGGGGGAGSVADNVGLDGGSGGGGSMKARGGTNVAGQGYAGGCGIFDPSYSGGGGGGAGSMGSNAVTKGGNGGVGICNSISGSTNYYAGGGGGGTYQLAGISYGGNGGGGNGGQSDTPAQAGAPNTGGGGGGIGDKNPGGTAWLGANGGSGIVIVRYSVTASSNTTSLSISSNGISQTSASVTNVLMGKVGIGTANPAENLHVAGNLRVDGMSTVAGVTLGGVPITNWSSIATGVLMVSSNLSDVANKAAARANLGLGSAATNNAGVFMTPTSDGSQLTNITAMQVGALSTNAEVLITANNLSELSATAPTARSNLGLGSAATNNASAFLSPDGNGSQLTGITAAQVGALGTNGGTISGELTILNPGGNIPMGVYTNQ